MGAEITQWLVQAGPLGVLAWLAWRGLQTLERVIDALPAIAASQQALAGAMHAIASSIERTGDNRQLRSAS